jgi:hypothetical protein
MTGSTSKRSLPTCAGFYGTKIKIQIQIQNIRNCLPNNTLSYIRKMESQAHHHENLETHTIVILLTRY